MPFYFIGTRSFYINRIKAKQMKVFAQFIDIDSFISIRKNTILQFGDSWKTIGAVWLINPGSSAPCNVSISDDELTMLNSIDNKEHWQVASIDPTMRFLEKILNGNYIGENRELNGVIRLFNLYNLREPNLSKALNTIALHPDIHNLITIEEDIASVSDIDNVYLGWGKDGMNSGRKYSERIFSQLSDRQKAYCNKDFMKNAFYHPMFVNRGIRFNSTKEWLRKYFDATK